MCTSHRKVAIQYCTRCRHEFCEYCSPATSAESLAPKIQLKEGSSKERFKFRRLKKAAVALQELAHSVAARTVHGLGSSNEKKDDEVSARDVDDELQQFVEKTEDAEK